MAIHDGHRDRVRKKIEQYGMECLQDHEVLEYLLFAVIPRKDTNELAHNILNECGSLREVFDSSVERLQKINGVTYNAAVFLSCLGDVSRRYYSNRLDTIYVRNAFEVVEYMRPLIASQPREEMHLLLINSKGRLIKRVLMNKGVVNETYCSVREIVDLALKNEAARVVLVHNHPSNNATPSSADIEMTERVYLALVAIGIPLEDHIIITKDTYFSFNIEHIIDAFGNGKVELNGGTIKRIVYS